ncbi:transglutaminase-like cysteine peptidase [Pseudoalteromonas sp.]|uniref:transglutaminase-like cysteine peptidase n=1 Tax=Pseudoalteromonas sp. TaxID=53249 RepID=UPI0030034074
MKGYIYISLIVSCCAFATNEITSKLLSTEALAEIERTYSQSGVERINKWLDFLKRSKHQSQWQKVALVNDFFNQTIAYQTDSQLWGKEDYWATPIETLAQGAGDCEDFAIAKYFSLLALGVTEDKIRLTYVRQLNVNEPHMVISYLEAPNDVPFILDNFNTELLPATVRTDIKPIYSFNGQGLWLAKAKGLGKKLNNNKGFSNWNMMLERIEHHHVSNASE